MEHTKRSRTITVAMILFVLLQGCAFVPGKDRAYDPDFERGETLFDQIPNWDGEALRKCGSDLDPSERTEQHSLRC